MSSNPKFFLLDAGPIIELHRLGRLDLVRDRAEVVVPRVIAEHEAQHWVRVDDSARPINTFSDAEAGRLTVLDCDVSVDRERSATVCAALRVGMIGPATPTKCPQFPTTMR